MDFTKYLKETIKELKEVTFPTTSQTIMYTILVILISIIVAGILGGSDFGLREGLVKLLAR